MMFTMTAIVIISILGFALITTISTYFVLRKLGLISSNSRLKSKSRRHQATAVAADSDPRDVDGISSPFQILIPTFTNHNSHSHSRRRSISNSSGSSSRNIIRSGSRDIEMGLMPRHHNEDDQQQTHGVSISQSTTISTLVCNNNDNNNNNNGGSSSSSDDHKSKKTPKYYNDSHASEIDIVEEKDLYIEKYRRDHPIDTSEGILNSEEIDYVLENGVDAWKLQVDSPEIIDKVEVMDGLDVTFKDTAFPSSIISSAGASGNDSSSTSNNNNSNNKNEVYGVSILSNIQFPNEQLVYYYEVKIEEFNNQGSMSETSSTTTTTTTSQEEHVADIKKATTTTNIAIGVAMKPFVPLRMAGWVNYSAAFHTESGKVYGGSRHKILATAMTKSPPTNSAAHNHSSPGGVIVMPNDVIGIGWRPRSGKMFVTRNGEIIAKLKTPWARKRLYPVISTNGPAKISANFGSRGFVMANANIQCWGLAPPEGMGPPPPMYGCQDESILLAYTPLIHAAAAAAAASSSSCSASSSECGDQENEDQVGGGYHLRTNSDVSALTLFSNGAANSDAINGDQSILPPPDYGYHQPKSIDDNSSSSSPSTSMASSLLQVPAYSHGGGGGSGNRGGLVAASFKPGDSGDLLLLSPSLTRSRSDPRENAAAAAAATTYIETPNRDQIESDTQNNDDSAQVSSRPHPSQCSIVVATSV